MAGATQIRAGGAVVEVSADLDPLKKGLGKAKGEVQSFGQSLAKIGSTITAVWSTIASSAVIAGLASSVKAFMDFGSAINDASLRTGVAASELQFLSFAAKQTGASLETVEQALKAMVRAGFKVSEFQSLGQSIASIQDPTQRTARALEVFGKSGTALLPMFSQLNDLRKQSAALGPMLSDEDVANADKLGDALGALGESFARLKQQVGSAAAPALLDTTNLLIGINAELAKLASQSGKTGGGSGILSNLGFVTGIGPGALFSQKAIDVFIKKGAEATNTANGMNAAQQRITDTLKQQAAAAKEVAAHQAAMKKQWDDLASRLTSASQRRMSLAREFQTDDEKFIAKQQEIARAIEEARKSLVFIGQDNVDREVAALQEAARRHQREGAAAQGKRFEEIGNELEGTVRVLKSVTRGTSSAFGAALLGRSAPEHGDVEEKQLSELKKSNDHLRKISDRVGPARFQ